MNIFLQYLIVFAVGGALCVVAQILIDKTRLTPARILVLYVSFGVLLYAEIIISNPGTVGVAIHRRQV
jgi:hypothetical protein